MNNLNAWESFHDSRLKELLSDITEISAVDYKDIGEIVVDQWRVDGNYLSVVQPLKQYFEDLAEKQIEAEWSEK